MSEIALVSGSTVHVLTATPITLVHRGTIFMLHETARRRLILTRVENSHVENYLTVGTASANNPG